MKKFTLTFLTAMVFTVVTMLSCFTVSAEETEMTMSISMEEYKELADMPTVAADDVSIETDNKTYSFYSQLDSNNQVAYDAMEANWIEPTTETATFNLVDTISYSVESTDISEWTEEQTSEFWNLVFSTFQTGQVAFEYDYPEVFWYDKNLMQISIGTSSKYDFRNRCYVLTVSKIELIPVIKTLFGDEQTALDAQNFLIEQIAMFEVEGDDYYSKIKYIHDYIINNVVYEMDAPYTDTAYGLFVEPYNIICEGYAEAFLMLCRKEGIPCISVIGNFEVENNIAHMWNYVMMEDDNWYAVDVTWDDLDNPDNPIKYQYFLKGSESFLDNHVPDNDLITPGFVYPELSLSDYVYGSEELITPAVTTTAVETTTTVSETAELTTMTTITIPTETTTTKATTTITTPTETTTTKVTTTVTTTAKPTTTTIKTTTITTTTKLNTTTPVTTTVVTTTQSTTIPPIEEVVKGDFNQNGIVDIGDVIALKKKLIKAEPIETDDFEYSLNDDNILNIWDYVILLRILINN